MKTKALKSIKGAGRVSVLALSLIATGLVGTGRASTPEELPAVSYLHQVLIGEDGSIFGAGGAGGRPLVIKLRPDGVVDERFAGGGVIELPELENSDPVDFVASPDGDLVVATGGSVVKITARGTRDLEFGEAGRVGSIPSRLLGGQPVKAAAVQGDGKVVVASATYQEGIRVARLTAAGDPDPTFGGDGTLHLSGPHPGTLTSVGDIEIDSQGRVVMAGEMDYAGGAMRLLSDGRLDPTFGTELPGYTDRFDPPAYAGMFHGISELVIGENDELRMYGYATVDLYVSRNLGYFFDEHGMPDGRPRTYGSFQGSGIFVETPDGLASSEGGFRGEPIFDIKKTETDGEPSEFNPPSFNLSPGNTRTTALGYSPIDDSLVAVGWAQGFDCRLECSDKTHMVAAKVDSRTGTPAAGFGTEGTVIIPGNECAFGAPSRSEGERAGAWKRCAVRPPRLEGRFRFRHPASRRPALWGTVEMLGAQAKPQLLERHLTVRLPKKIHLNSMVGSKLSIKVSGAEREDWSAKLRGRTIFVDFAPRSDLYDSFYGPEAPLNGPVEVGLGLKRGALEPIARRHRRAPLHFALGARYVPTDQSYDIGGPSSHWFAPSGAYATVKARPLPAKGRARSTGSALPAGR